MIKTQMGFCQMQPRRGCMTELWNDSYWPGRPNINIVLNLTK